MSATALAAHVVRALLDLEESAPAGMESEIRIETLEGPVHYPRVVLTLRVRRPGGAEVGITRVLLPRRAFSFVSPYAHARANITDMIGMIVNRL